MKNLILSTIAAAALVLTAGTALASDASPDNGFAVYLQSQAKAPVARSGATNYPIGTDNGFAAYQQDSQVKGSATFLSGSADNDDHIFSNNGRDAIEFRKTQEQGR